MGPNRPNYIETMTLGAFIPMSREELGFALLLSVPVGVGVALAVLKTSGGYDPQLSVAAGVVTTLALFILVAVIVLHEPDTTD